MLNLNTAQQTVINSILNAFSTNNTSALNVLLSAHTKVATSAKFKALNITKVATLNATLNANNVYTTSVINSALHNNVNNANNINNIVNFTAQQQAHYIHLPDCYAIVQHATNNTLYLYVTVNSASSAYFINNVAVNKADILQYLTASAVKALTTNNVVNKQHDFTHSVNVKQYKLSNVQSLTILNNNANSVIVNNTFTIA